MSSTKGEEAKQALLARMNKAGRGIDMEVMPETNRDHAMAAKGAVALAAAIIRMDRMLNKDKTYDGMGQILSNLSVDAYEMMAKYGKLMIDAGDAPVVSDRPAISEEMMDHAIQETAASSFKVGMVAMRDMITGKLDTIDCESDLVELMDNILENTTTEAHVVAPDSPEAKALEAKCGMVETATGVSGVHKLGTEKKTVH